MSFITIIGFDGSHAQYHEHLLPWLDQSLRPGMRIGLELPPQSDETDFVDHGENIGRGEAYFESLRHMVRAHGGQPEELDSLRARTYVNLSGLTQTDWAVLRESLMHESHRKNGQSLLANLLRWDARWKRADAATRRALAARREIVDSYLRPLFMAKQLLKRKTEIAILKPETAIAVARLLEVRGVGHQVRWFGKPNPLRRWTIRQRAANAQFLRRQFASMRPAAKRKMPPGASPRSRHA
jgi:hypothetical protein